ncbi:DUF4402 domain-containing protein [Novosphingobium sp. FSY-8]|uniref:DUF4402 domain-containing protein n=1 Tax=Novosphingobium ovatum TaxID=1908523 RepID=A0ABW9XEA8_9SPHN|nr:DUF4402 domain-containing protein [Novosphingobium ovatum]NBC36884.1 DUF4402 domain-containing protein [Novosphingobium ovatum]
METTTALARHPAQPATLALLLTAIALLAAPHSALAASGNTSTKAGASTAQVVKPIRLIHGSSSGEGHEDDDDDDDDDDHHGSSSSSSGSAALSFGKFTVGTGGTVVVSTSGSGTATSGVRFVPGSSTTADSFRVTGDPNRAFAIATTSGTVTRGSRSMSFTTTPSRLNATLSGSGNGSFTVGGTLTVPSTITPGVYTGSYSAMVSYN